MATSKKKSAARAVRYEEKRSEIVVGNCVRVVIRVRAKCRDGGGKTKVAALKSAGSGAKMVAMSGGPPTGGGSGTEPESDIEISIDINS